MFLLPNCFSVMESKNITMLADLGLAKYDYTVCVFWMILCGSELIILNLTEIVLRSSLSSWITYGFILTVLNLVYSYLSSWKLIYNALMGYKWKYTTDLC